MTSRSARAGVAVALTHGVNSTATAYNITVRVYLSDVMRLLAYANSVLRQNSLSVVQNDSVVTIDVSTPGMSRRLLLVWASTWRGTNFH